MKIERWPISRSETLRAVLGILLRVASRHSLVHVIARVWVFLISNDAHLECVVIGIIFCRLIINVAAVVLSTRSANHSVT